MTVMKKGYDVEPEVNTTLAEAAAIFRRLDIVWKFSFFSMKIKLRLDSVVVALPAIYASETWTNTVRPTDKK